VIVWGVVVVAALAAVLIVPRFTRHSGNSVSDDDILTTTAWKGPYDHTITARGTVTSAASTELICEVRSGGPATILDVVPEGTFVEAGETVITLDAGVLEDLADQQRIAISTRESLLSQAENTLKAAKIAKTEYLEGLFVSQEKQLEADLYIAERAKATAEAGVESAKTLYEKAIANGQQLELAYTVLADATNKYDTVQTSLTTLRTLTKEKELTLLEAAIASADAIAKEHRRGLELEQRRLDYLEAQIAKCTIVAPAAGEVVYANEPDYYRTGTSSPFVVEPGAQVRDRQVIVRLPDPNDMQIRVEVTEARITLVRPGMPVSIRLDAYDGEILSGEVVKVNLFPEPGSYYGTRVNKYAVTIKINDPPPLLRIGMTAEAWIHVEQTPEALQVPVQALAESQGHYFSLVRAGESYETREIAVSSINEEVATIEGGLEEGDEVVINPRSAGDLLEIPEIPEPAMLPGGEIDPGEARGLLNLTSSPDGGRDDMQSRSAAEAMTR
jgi:multidrug resistance efflux pump